MNRASAPLITNFGSSLLHCFSFGDHEEDNVLVIEVGNFRLSRLVRVQSACYTGEIFASVDCDCHEQLTRSLELIHEGGGLFVYMLADGRGAGLLTKIRGLALAADGLDTFDAYQALGVEPDPRSYERVVEVLLGFDVDEVRLLTNNPRKVMGLESGGIRVQREPLQVEPTPGSRAYLATKREKFGHYLEP
jgi:GTP cyclohydrolase II